MVAGMRSLRAEKATPWAWFPIVYVSVQTYLGPILVACWGRGHTGTARHDALPPVLGREMGHLVVRAAQLEAEDGLQVLALEENIAF